MGKVFCRVVLALLLCCAGRAYAQAQTSEEVTKFKAALEQALKEKGVDAQHSALHFAILMNTVRISEPGDQLMRDIYQDMLNNYLVENGGASEADYVSFFPFQNEIWQEYQQTPTLFTRALAKDMINKMPVQVNDKETRGGHNIEKAVLDAFAVIANTDNGRLLPSTALIVLSDIQTSSPPNGDPDYRQEPQLTKFNETLKGYHVSQAKHDSLQKYMAAPPNSKAYTATMYYRIYLPDTLKPLKALSKSRQESLASGSHTDSGKVPPPPYQKPPDPGTPFPLWIIPAGIVAALAAGGIGFMLWVNKPRGVMVNEMTITVSRGKPMYLGGEEAGKNVVVLAGMPRGEKVAQVVVTGQGQVALQDADMYKVGRGRATGPVILTPALKTIPVTDKRPDGERYELRARTV